MQPQEENLSVLHRLSVEECRQLLAELRHLRQQRIWEVLRAVWSEQREARTREVMRAQVRDLGTFLAMEQLRHEANGLALAEALVAHIETTLEERVKEESNG